MTGPRGSGRGGVQHREKAKAKKKRRDSHHSIYFAEKAEAGTSEAVFEKTANSLRTLGKQIFALSPFSEHYNRWLTDVKMVLSEYESSPLISLDDWFAQERSRILSRVELELAEKGHGESSTNEIARQLSENRAILEQIEEECKSETKKMEEKRDQRTRLLSKKIADLKDEHKTVSEMKTGFFRGLSSKAKAQKLTEVEADMKQAETAISTANQNYASSKELIANKYRERKKPIEIQVEEQERQISIAEIDSSCETRRDACEDLINAITKLNERKRSPASC
jgi:hypothetical protein